MEVKKRLLMTFKTDMDKTVSTDYLIGVTDEKSTFNNISNNAEDLYYLAEKYLKRNSVMLSGKPISEKSINKILRHIEFGISMAEDE